MVKTTIITHALLFALRLIDTTTGNNISGQNVNIIVDGKAVGFDVRGDQLLIFQNLNGDSFQMEIRAKGYEPKQVRVDLTSLSKLAPLLEEHLIPSEEQTRYHDFLTLEGTLPGIEELTAIRSEENSCMIREFDQRKRLITVFNPHHLELNRIHYAVVDPDQNCFEPFRILNTVNETTIKSDRVLEMPFRNYFPVTPVVMGQCQPDGRYCLRVRDQGSKASWLVRWKVNGQAYFRLINFRETPHPVLE